MSMRRNSERYVADADTAATTPTCTASRHGSSATPVGEAIDVSTQPADTTTDGTCSSGAGCEHDNLRVAEPHPRCGRRRTPTPLIRHHHPCHILHPASTRPAWSGLGAEQAGMPLDGRVAQLLTWRARSKGTKGRRDPRRVPWTMRCLNQCRHGLGCLLNSQNWLGSNHAMS